MALELVIKYIHFLSIFVIVGTVTAEWMLLKPELTRGELRRLATIDSLYGLAAILLLGAGFSLWFWVGKPAITYSRNWIFMVKLTLFVIIGLLSIYPTVFFRKNRKGDRDEAVDVPPIIRSMILAELVLLALIPIAAVTMAKGIGYMAE